MNKWSAVLPRMGVPVKQGGGFMVSGRRFAGITAAIAAYMRLPSHRRCPCRATTPALRQQSRHSRKGKVSLRPVGPQRTRLPPKQHGLMVDAVVTAWVAEGRVPDTHPDPCCAALASYLRMREWVPLAAQPVFALSAVHATAADLVCCTKDRRQLVLVEVKSTQADAHDAAIACYARGRGLLRRTPLARWPKSRALEHQIQLALMHHGLAVLGAEPDQSVVLRVTPRGVLEFPLHPAVRDAAGAILEQMEKSGRRRGRARV